MMGKFGDHNLGSQKQSLQVIGQNHAPQMFPILGVPIVCPSQTPASFVLLPTYHHNSILRDGQLLVPGRRAYH